MKKIRIPAEVGDRILTGQYNGVPLYSYIKICDIEAYEIREEDANEEEVKDTE